jgi:intraflagellar transport protein 52
MATHPPRMVDPQPPALELFDLDEDLSDVRVRLARLTNQYKDDSNLDPYLQEVTRILGLNVNDVGGEMSPKHVLHYIGEQVGLPIISLYMAHCVMMCLLLFVLTNSRRFLFVNVMTLFVCKHNNTHFLPDITAQARIVPNLLFTIVIIRFSLVIVTNIKKE